MELRFFDKKGDVDNLYEPAFIRISPVNIKGTPSHRMMIIVKSNGCEYAKKDHGGCSMCGFSNHLNGSVSEEQILKQIDYALETVNLDGVEEINFFTIGSFLNDNELSWDFRKSALTKLSKKKEIKRITIEGRAEHVSAEKLKKCKEIVRDKILEYGIGIESSNDYIRNDVVNKNLSKEEIENIFNIAREVGIDLYIYLLIKPFGLTEKEAIKDAVNSAEYIFFLSKKYGVYTRVAFEPMFVVENTKLEQSFLNGEYELLNLWSVLDVIRQTMHLGEIFIGLSDEHLSDDRKPFSCKNCYDALIKGFEIYNLTQRISELETIQCNCKNDYHKMLI